VARPWIEFVQSQRLPWENGVLSAVRPGVEVKRLSGDTETGACTLVVRYPAGWSAAGGALEVDDEFLVIDGVLEIDGRRYGNLSYAHLPAGYEARRWSSTEGAVVLEFFSGTPVRALEPLRYDDERLVEYKSGFEVPYTANFHPEFPPGAGRKILYVDPVTRDTTWLLGTLPVRWNERAEAHPTVEEMYLLAGEVHGNRGVMRPGAYFWRPPSIPHGPYGSLTGSLYLFRTKGGTLSTTYTQTERKFEWWPEYKPVLSPELEPYRGEAPAGARCW
jgi:hypothetical protein